MVCLRGGEIEMENSSGSPTSQTSLLRATLIVAGALTIPSLALSQSANGTNKPDFASVQAFIEQKIANEHVPSVSVAVARKGEIIWEKGLGWANREKRVPASERSMYSLASVTKLMTASAIMVLRDGKQLDLDRPVNDYLGSAKLTSPVWNPSDATVRRVATHTAGLATYDNGYYCRGNEGNCEDIMIRRFGVLIWRPGERFDYSNLGYGVLGDVIRHVSGMKYGDFLTKQVLAPLGMMHCSIGIASGLEAYEAQRYSGSDGSPADWSPNEPSSQEAASSVFCSAHDLLRFGMFHLKEHVAEKAILSSSAIDEMQESVVPADDGLRYGFGWWHEERFGYKVMYVSGGYEYAQALLFTVPSEQIVVVVLMNTGHATLAQEVADEVVSSLIPTYRENRAKAAHTGDQRSPTSPNMLVSLAGTWSGQVHTDTREVPLTLIIDKSGVVHASVASQPAVVEAGPEYRDGQFQAKISGPPGLYERDARKALALDLQLFRRSGDVLNGGATTVPLSQPEWGLVTYFVQLTADKKK
jgi:CubicO group peptidase (beta-lactamase class C family)